MLPAVGPRLSGSVVILRLRGRIDLYLGDERVGAALARAHADTEAWVASRR